MTSLVDCRDAWMAPWTSPGDGTITDGVSVSSGPTRTIGWAWKISTISPTSGSKCNTKHHTSNIRRTKSQHLNVLVSSCRRHCPIHWSQVLGREWRWSWSSADMRCYNFIWVINNFIAYLCASYIRGLTVHVPHYSDVTWAWRCPITGKSAAC